MLLSLKNVQPLGVDEAMMRFSFCDVFVCANVFCMKYM